MTTHVQKEISLLKKQVLELGGLAETLLSQSISSLMEFNLKQARQVIDDDQLIDAKEVEIEENCLKILALHQPVAIDLRYVVSALKINNDLERVGDLAVNIAKRAKYLSKHDPVESPFDLEGMSSKVKLMLRKSLDSLVQLDAKLAYEVCKDDQEVDELNRQAYTIVYDSVKSNPEHIISYIQYLSVSKNLERIADYATNIAEDVIYMIEGKIVRHNFINF